MNRLRFTGLAACGLMLAMGTSAFADVTFYLTVPENGTANCASQSNGCAPADTVLVDVDLLTSGAGISTATVTFTGETVASTTYLMYSVLFKVNGSFGISSDVVTVSGTPTTTLTPGVVATALDEYGTFSEGLTVHDASSVVFNLDDGTWTSAANVLAATTGWNPSYYSQGFDAAAQVRTGPPPGGPKTPDTAGFETATVPEPTSMFLFGSVALLLAGSLRRKLVR